MLACTVSFLVSSPLPHDLHAIKSLLNDAGVDQGLCSNHIAIVEDLQTLNVHAGVFGAEDVGEALS